MAIDVAVYRIPNHKRSRITTEEMIRGIKRCGDRPKLLDPSGYTHPDCPVAVFYGYTPKLRQVMRDYRAAGLAAVYIDLGYWKRRVPGPQFGYHKISVNSRHPTVYFQNCLHGNERFKSLQVEMGPWRESGNHILLAGMGFKAAEAEGLKFESWENAAVEKIRRFTDRKIIYRPKPSCRFARPLANVGYSQPSDPLLKVFENCHAIVTHHSNVAVDGLIAGIPVLCVEGVALPQSTKWEDLDSQYIPRYGHHDDFPNHRNQWAADVAWTQFNVVEMAEGLPWRHLKKEGLIP